MNSQRRGRSCPHRGPREASAPSREACGRRCADLAPAGRRRWQFSVRNLVANRPSTLERSTRSTPGGAVVPAVASLPGDITLPFSDTAPRHPQKADAIAGKKPLGSRWLASGAGSTALRFGGGAHMSGGAARSDRGAARPSKPTVRSGAAGWRHCRAAGCSHRERRRYGSRDDRIDDRVEIVEKPLTRISG